MNSFSIGSCAAWANVCTEKKSAAWKRKARGKCVSQRWTASSPRIENKYTNKNPWQIKNVRAVTISAAPLLTRLLSAPSFLYAVAGCVFLPDWTDKHCRGIVLPSPTNRKVTASLPQGALSLWHPVIPGPPGEDSGFPQEEAVLCPGSLGALWCSFLIPLGIQGAKLENFTTAPHPPTGVRAICEIAVGWATTLILWAVK